MRWHRVSHKPVPEHAARTSSFGTQPHFATSDQREKFRSVLFLNCCCVKEHPGLAFFTNYGATGSMGDLIILAEFVKQRSLATGSCDPQPSTSRTFTNYDWLPLFQTENEHLKSSVNQPACVPNFNDAGIVFHRGQSPVESIQFEMAPKAKARCCSYIHTYTSVDPETSMRKKPARLRIPEFSAETGET